MTRSRAEVQAAKEEAEAAKADAAAVRAAITKAAKPIEGLWRVTYHPNGVTRVYKVDSKNGVSLVAENKNGTLSQRGADLILTLSDDEGKVERWTALADGRLLVEHYNPGSAYPAKAPDEIGIGVRAE